MKREDRATGGTPVRRGRSARGRALALVAAATLTTAGAACHGFAGGASCDNAVSSDTVQLKDFAFDPSCVSAPSGSSLDVTDTGSVPHTFTVDGSDIDVRLDPGSSRTVDLGSLARGTYDVVCTIHPQMVGALKVT